MGEVPLHRGPPGYGARVPTPSLASGGHKARLEVVRARVLLEVLLLRPAHRRVDVRLHGNGNSNSYGARPVY